MIEKLDGVITAAVSWLAASALDKRYITADRVAKQAITYANKLKEKRGSSGTDTPEELFICDAIDFMQMALNGIDESHARMYIEVHL